MMFHIRNFVQLQKLSNNNLNLLIIPCILSKQSIHTSNVIFKATRAEKEVKEFMKHNDVVFPPQKEGEERQPAFVCHYKERIKYSPDKMWYIACMVRGMSIENAVKQLDFVFKKGAPYVRDTILEAQELAVKEHNVEFKSNLWIAESFAVKDLVIKGIRRHARGRMGQVEYKYCTYFVRLEEGKPPKNYYYTGPETGPEKLEQWLATQRYRKIPGSL